MVKIIAALLGWQVAGLFGAIAGYYIGSYFERGLGGFSRPLSSGEQARVGACYFETTFTLLGYLAKADGRISEEEIAQAEALMSRMGLTADHRQQAIGFFKSGSRSDFSLDETMKQFKYNETSNLSQSNTLRILSENYQKLHVEKAEITEKMKLTKQ